MPVTFDIDPKSPQRPLTSSGATTAKDYISEACPDQAEICQEVLQASFGESAGLTRGEKPGDGSGIGDVKEMRKIRGGGFVNVAVEAYNQHYHLVIRPDDVWISILSQLSFYVNAHAEELGSFFVSHEGKKELRVVVPSGNRYTVDFARMSQLMGRLLRENVKDANFCDWILAEFSTTTEVDRTIYAIEMMATLKEYFSYTCHILCGLPRVTLEGTQADWEILLRRIDTLTQFGPEPTRWAGMLSAVLKRFVRTFEVFSAEETAANHKERNGLRKFWNQIACYKGGGSGPTWLSGWITAFCPFNSKGTWIDGTCAPGTTPPALSKGSGKRSKGSKRKNLTNLAFDNPPELRRAGVALVLDGEMFPILDSQKVPKGFVEVDVKLDDNGKEFDTLLVAGHLGGRVLKASAAGQDARLGLAPGWFMFIKDKEKVEKAP